MDLNSPSLGSAHFSPYRPDGKLVGLSSAMAIDTQAKLILDSTASFVLLLELSNLSAKQLYTN
jgi:hypothetical protein